MTIIGIIIFVLSPFLIMFMIDGISNIKSFVKKLMKRNEVVPTKVLAHLIASRILSTENFNVNSKVWIDVERDIKLYHSRMRHEMEVWVSGKQIFLNDEEKNIIINSIKKARRIQSEKDKLKSMSVSYTHLRRRRCSVSVK